MATGLIWHHVARIPTTLIRRSQPSGPLRGWERQARALAQLKRRLQVGSSRHLCGQVSKGGNRMKTCMTVWHGKVDWQNKGYTPQLQIFIVDFLLEHCYRAYLVQSSNLWSLLKERTVLLGVLKALLWDISLFFFSQKIWINLLFLVVLCLHCSYRLSLVAESQGFCGG